jgi:hypothetical protein
MPQQQRSLFGAIRRFPGSRLFGTAITPFVLSLTWTSNVSAAGDILFQDGFEAALAGETCSSGRLLRSDVTYGPIHPTQINPPRLGIDATEWDAIWGHASATDDVSSWPGKSGSAPVLRNFMRTSFVAAHFRTPAGASATSTLKGFFTYPLDWNNPNADIAISTRCGDFSPNAANPGCVATNVSASNEILLFWKFSPGNGSDFCILQPDRDYFVNIRLTDPTSRLRCDPLYGVGNCPLYVVHSYGGTL